MEHETKWTLDGEAVEVADVLMDPCIDDETRGLVLALAPGEEIDLGGGAFASAVLRREA